MNLRVSMDEQLLMNDEGLLPPAPAPPPLQPAPPPAPTPPSPPTPSLKPDELVALTASLRALSPVSNRLECQSTTDCTDVVQAALDNPKQRPIVLSARDGGWPVAPLYITQDNTHIVLEANCTLFARNGSFTSTSAMLLRATNVSNITIEGAGSDSSVLQMSKAVYMADRTRYPKGEWRMGLAFYDCSDVVVRNLTVRESGGDGVYINNVTRGVLLGVRSLANYRQGMSIISATHLLVEECEFADTSGTEPAAGIDFEPVSSWM